MSKKENRNEVGVKEDFLFLKAFGLASEDKLIAIREVIEEEIGEITLEEEKRIINKFYEQADDIYREMDKQSSSLENKDYKFIFSFENDDKIKKEYLNFLEDKLNPAKDIKFAAGEKVVNIETASKSSIAGNDSLKIVIDSTNQNIQIRTKNNKDFEIEYEIVIRNLENPKEELVLFAGKGESSFGMLKEDWNYNWDSINKELAQKIKNKLKDNSTQFRIYVKVYELLFI